MSPFEGDWLDGLPQIPKLSNSAGYDAWAFVLKLYFRTQGIWSIVSGETAKPTDVHEAKEWSRQDAQALLTMLLLASDLQSALIRRENTAAGAWLALERRHRGHGADAILRLFDKLHSTKYVEGSDMTDHVGVFTNVKEQLALLDENMSDIAFIAYLLHSLPPSWDEYVALLRTTLGDQLRSKDAVVNQLVREGERRRTSEGNASSQGKKAKKKKGSAGGRGPAPICIRCQSRGHFPSQCRTNPIDNPIDGWDPEWAEQHDWANEVNEVW